jgi:hypothetical protein
LRIACYRRSTERRFPLANTTWKNILVLAVKDAALLVVRDHAEYVKRVELTPDGAQIITGHDVWVVEVKHK